MSIPNNEENINYIIPEPIKPVIKPPMYYSKFCNSVKLAWKNNKDCHRTMGYVKVPLQPPSQFLKKNTRNVAKPLVEEHKTWCPVKSARGSGATRRPWTRLRDDEPKNYLQMNIIDVMRKVPPLPKNRVQETRNGHVTVVNKPVFKNFGKSPKYIIKRKNDMEVARLQEEERIEASRPLPPLRLVSEEERTQLIKNIQNEMVVLNTEFLLLPVMTDTIQKKRKKSYLERLIRELEIQVEILIRKKTIFVDRNA